MPVSGVTAGQPITEAWGDSVSTSVAALEAADSAHVAAADPHTGYRLESADHSHASTGLQAGTIAHSVLSGLTSGDPHTQYQQESQKQAASGYPGLDAAGFVVGNGLAFPAVQVPSADANTLDDYEEGTFTPGITFGGGSTGLTWNTRGGQYIKVGRLVTCSLYMVLTNKGSSTGAAKLIDLPFTSDSSSAQGGGPSQYFANMATLTSIPALSILQSSTTGNIQHGSTTGMAQLTNAHFTNTTYLYFSFAYFAAA